MDKGTIIGLVAAIILILGSILIGGPLGPYIDIPSIIIVFGGTIAAALMCERLENVLSAFKVAAHAFKNQVWSPNQTIETIIELSTIARRDGALALEGHKIDDTFLAKGVRMTVDGIPEDEIRTTLVGELIAMKDRHQRGMQLFKFMGAMAPAMGMIGTLIGLVQMLQSLDDPSSIGPAMAVALLTTLYGALIANLFCIPVAEKLARRSAEETAHMSVVIDGVESIAKGHNAMIIKDKLEARLAPKERKQSKAA